MHAHLAYAFFFCTCCDHSLHAKYKDIYTHHVCSIVKGAFRCLYTEMLATLPAAAKIIWSRLEECNACAWSRCVVCKLSDVGRCSVRCCCLVLCFLLQCVPSFNFFSTPHSISSTRSFLTSLIAFIFCFAVGLLKDSCRWHSEAQKY